MIQDRAVVTMLGKDLRFAIRTFAERPGFTTVVVLTLALAIGSNVAIFSIVSAVLLRPLPYEDPERLALIWNRMTNANRPSVPVSGPDFLDYRDQTTMFEGFAGAIAVEATLTGEQRPEQVMMGWSTGNLFEVLGVRAFLGRTFEPTDATPIDPKSFLDPNAKFPPGAILVTHGMWQRMFGSDPKIVGRTIQLDGHSQIIVGVLPPEFRIYLPAYAGMPTNIDAWGAMPVDFSTTPRDGEWLTVVARLKPEVALEQAQAEMDALAARFREQFQHHKSVGMEIAVNSMHRDVVNHVRPLLLTLLAASGFVLLIACANVANLLLVRASEREREIAVRAALGGGRGRIAMQMFTECGVLAAAGGLLGLLIGWAGIRTMLAMVPPDSLPRLETVGIDVNVLLFTAGASLLAALVFGATPALKAGSPDLANALKDRGSDSGGVRGNKVRTALVVTEVALSLVLLIGAGLMLRSYAKLQRVDPGFDSDEVLTVSVPLPFFKYRDPDARVNLFERLAQRVRELPGVESVGGVTPLPLGGGDQYWVQPYGRDNATEEEWSANRADYRAVVPGYTEAMGIRLLAGRPLTEADNQAVALNVVVVDKKLADQTWPNEDPVGKAMQIVRFDFESMQLKRAPVQVVGVVEHVRSESLTKDGRGAIYYPYRFFPWWPMTLTIRAATNPLSLVGAIRTEVAALDQDVPVADVRLMGDYVKDSMASARLTLTLISVFAAVALLLASIGLYGVISYSLRQRTQEFGVRMAFGAGSRSIVRLVVSQGILLGISGVGLGMIGASALTRTASSLLFGVSPLDPVTFAFIPAFLVGITTVASYIPARRATAIDPVDALRGKRR